MRVQIHQRQVALVDSHGVLYDRVRVYAEPQDDGRWAGWLQFVAAGNHRKLRTDRETTQSGLAALAYWAGGLQPVYLEGALARAEAWTARGHAGASAGRHSKAAHDTRR
jgi:hypothetical protein